MSRPAHASRNLQLIRALTIIRELSRAGGADLYELAQRHGTTVRTIRRDLDGLEAVGLPLADEPGDGKKKRWRIAYRDKLSTLSDLLDVSHYLALRVSMEGLSRRGQLFADLEDLADKIEQHLGPSERASLRAVVGAFHSYEKHVYTADAPDVFWPIVQAIAGRRMCEIDYRAASRRNGSAGKAFRALPLRLFTFQQAVYLHAYVKKHDDVIVLNLQRLRGLKVLAERAAPPQNYHPEKLERAAFGVFVGKKTVDYHLRFRPQIAPFIRERQWHPSQRLRTTGDDGVELRFTCTDSPEVRNWICSWRGEVEVLAPTSLRAELADLGRWMTETYAG